MGKKKPSKKENFKFHERQFAEFLDYLRINDAIITIKHRVNGETFKKEYFGDHTRSGATIRDIFGELGFADSSLDEYLRKLPITNSHSSDDRAKEIGTKIESITFYVPTSERLDKSQNILKGDDVFAVRSNLAYLVEHKNGVIDYEGKFPGYITQSEKFEQFNGDRFRDFPQQVVDTTQFILDTMNGYLPTSIVSLCKSTDLIFAKKLTNEFIFSKLLDRLESDNSMILEEIYSYFKTYAKYYQIFSNDNKRMGYLLPGYVDYRLCHSISSSKRFIRFMNSHDINEIMDVINQKNISDYINFRYEIINWIQIEDIDICKANSAIKSLLLLSAIEYQSMVKLIHYIANYLTENTRFSIYSSIGNHMKYQLDSLKLIDLVDRLQDFLISDNITELFSIQGFSLLNKALFKYPEKSIAVDSIDAKVLRNFINEILKNYYQNRLEHDLIS